MSVIASCVAQTDVGEGRVFVQKLAEVEIVRDRDLEMKGFEVTQVAFLEDASGRMPKSIHA